jgi:hypothetical protein
VRFSTSLCLLIAAIGSTSLLPPSTFPASSAAVALPAVAMRADTEHGFTSVAASLSKETLWHADDDKPPLRSGDEDDYPIPNRRVVKKPRFLMRGNK